MGSWTSLDPRPNSHANGQKNLGSRLQLNEPLDTQHVTLVTSTPLVCKLVAVCNIDQ